jgi:hypothetical protein
LAGSSSTLGRGPFVGGDVTAEEAGWSEIADVAAGLDTWLGARATPLAELWREVLRCAGRRTIVIYGLGRNGRALLRALPEGMRDLLLFDDYVDDADGLWAHLSAASKLDPIAHYVFITPYEDDAIAHRLEARGFRSGRDMTTLQSFCERDRREAPPDDVERDGRARATCPPAAWPRSECTSTRCRPDQHHPPSVEARWGD